MQAWTRGLRTISLGVSMVALLPTVRAMAQSTDANASSAVAEVYRCGARCQDEVRTILGRVSRYDEGNASSSKSFILEDDFGQALRVVTTGALPAREARISVRGVVTIDRSGDPYLLAQSIAVPGAAPPPDSDRDGVPDPEDRCASTPAGARVLVDGCEAVDWTRRGLIAAGIVLVLAGIGVSLYLSRGREGSKDRVTPGAAQGEVQGETVRIRKIPEGTLQVLPGRLEVISGPDKGTQIRFLRDPAQRVPEITFGRSGDPSATHVVLRSPAVSRLHARLTWDGTQWSMENLSATNPTTVNGSAIAANNGSIALPDGAKIELGEVEFRFSAK